MEILRKIVMRNEPIVVLSVVRCNWALVRVIARDDLPVDNFAVNLLTVTE